MYIYIYIYIYIHIYIWDLRFRVQTFLATKTYDVVDELAKTKTKHKPNLTVKVF